MNKNIKKYAAYMSTAALNTYTFKLIKFQTEASC